MTTQLEQTLYLSIASLSLIGLLNKPINTSSYRHINQEISKSNKSNILEIKLERYAIPRKDEALDLIIYSLTSKTPYFEY